MKNLLQETLKAIKDGSQTPQDVVYVGNRDGTTHCTWREFCVHADHEYDEFTNVRKVSPDLIISFKDGSWLERFEEWSFEGWEFKNSIPDRPATADPSNIKSIFGSLNLTDLRFVMLGE